MDDSIEPKRYIVDFISNKSLFLYGYLVIKFFFIHRVVDF